MHMMKGCPATDSQDWPVLVAEAWAVAAKAVGVPMPSVSTMAQSCIMLLLGALLLAWLLTGDCGLFLHPDVGSVSSGPCLRQEHLMAAFKAPRGEHEPTGAGQPAVVMPCSLLLECQMSVEYLREAEKRCWLAAECDVCSGMVLPLPWQ